MFCPNCGSNILAGMWSCSDCGATLFIDANGKIIYKLPSSQSGAHAQHNMASQQGVDTVAAQQTGAVQTPHAPTKQAAPQTQTANINNTQVGSDSSGSNLTPEQGLTLETPIRPGLDNPAPKHDKTWIVFAVIALIAISAVLFGFTSGIIPQEFFGITTPTQLNTDTSATNLQATDVLQQESDSNNTAQQEQEPRISLLSATPPLPSKNPVDTTWSFTTKLVDKAGNFTYPALSSTGDTAIIDWLNARNEKAASDAFETSKTISEDDAEEQADIYQKRTILVTRLTQGSISFVDTGSKSTGTTGSYAFLSGSNYNLVNGDSLSPAQMVSLDDDELSSRAIKAITTYVKKHTKAGWWGDVDADLVLTSIHYFVIDDGVCAAVTEGMLGPQELGMLMVFVTPFDEKTSNFKQGDEIKLDKVVKVSGTASLSASQIASILGIES